MRNKLIKIACIAITLAAQAYLWNLHTTHSIILFIGLLIIQLIILCYEES